MHSKAAIRVEENILFSEHINAGIHGGLDFLNCLHLLVGTLHTSASNLFAVQVILG